MLDPLILVRFVHIAATVLACGTVGFVVLVADAPELRQRLRRTIWIALLVAILSGAAWLVLLTTEILGGSILDACLHGGALQVASDTQFGLVFSLRLLLALGLGVLMLIPAARWPQLIAAATFAALLGPIGHAGANPGTAGSVHLAADMAHLLAASAWLGALPAFAMLLAQADTGKARRWRALTAQATRRFSVLGIACVATLMASGIVNSWNLLSGPRDLIATDYGRWVALKIGLFAAMVCIAAVNRYHLTPQLPAAGALGALRRNSLIETGLGLCVLLFVGVLGTIAPAAHVHPSSAAIPPDAAFVHIHDAEAMADVTIDPGRAGRVTATIRVMREDSSELAAQVVGIALDPPFRGGKTVERAAKRTADGTWAAENLELPQSGIWTVRVTVTPESGKPVVLDAPIVIER